ncbi:MAG TPA: SDR family NAD(P)-dependent oxidoreductase [Marmoricola sp.]|nr:SDR family NAD(P)-dependent oxidoreductase [Marmoricola sp.]
MSVIVIFGATSGIATAAARQWVARGAEFRLVSRDAESLDKLAADLRARGAASVTTSAIDLGDRAGVEDAVDRVFDAGPIDIALIAFGTMSLQEAADRSAEVAFSMLELNGTLCLLAAHLVALRLEGQGFGQLGVIGSVAGDRGRKSNYLYGAAKAMVATGVAGLQHRLASSAVSITLIKPGPTATPMTDHLRGGKLRLARADTVAADIVRGIDRGATVVYTPRKWALIMAVIRRVPRRLFERTDL